MSSLGVEQNVTFSYLLRQIIVLHLIDQQGITSLQLNICLKSKVQGRPTCSKRLTQKVLYSKTGHGKMYIHGIIRNHSQSSFSEVCRHIIRPTSDPDA